MGSGALMDEKDRTVEQAAKEMQVLVVDDSAVYRKLVADTLYYQPYSLLFAQSGTEALNIFAEHSPSIILTDWMMPDITGIELCRRIRSDTQSSYTYVILLTSMTEKDSVVQGLESGADDYLTKPFDPGELQARLAVGRRMIQLHRQIESKNRQLEEAVRIDPLTGLPNHRAITEWANWQLRGAALHGFQLWVLLTDIDGFSKINETHGQEAGDTVLKEFAQIVKDNARPSDIWGRVADDEFISILTHVGNAEIESVIEQYRQKFEAHKFAFNGRQETVTASFGVAGFSGLDAPEFSALVREADRALFAAKQEGGNRIGISR
jgi:two-component system cell cycle response regulator